MLRRLTISLSDVSPQLKESGPSWTNLHTLYTLCTHVQLFVLHCKTTWRHPGLSFSNQSQKSFFFEDLQTYRQTRLGSDASCWSIKNLSLMAGCTYLPATIINTKLWCGMQHCCYFVVNIFNFLELRQSWVEISKHSKISWTWENKNLLWLQIPSVSSTRNLKLIFCTFSCDTDAICYL